jgi:hypothetical protein
MNRTFIFVIGLVLFACSPAPTPIPMPAPPTQLNADVEMEAAFQQARDMLDSFIQRSGHLILTEHWLP